MKISTYGRHVREGVKNLGRNGWMTFASVSAVTITLLILGVFLLLALNVNHMAKLVENQVEIRVFMDVTSDKAVAENLQKQVKVLPAVDTVTYVPKDQGLKDLREQLGENGKLLDGLEKENPLPDTLVVKTKEPKDVDFVAQQVKEMEHIEDVDYGADTVNNLFVATNIMRNVGIFFIIGLAFTAMFLIANTIKLTIVARRREIEIMKLVGATNWFIRWPFFVEGLFMGVMGAIIPITILSIGYYYLLQEIHASMYSSMLPLLPMDPFAYQVGLLLMGIGAFIGIWGSMLSVRKFLKV
ncbi:ABC transporter permease [Brevibacillus laterosporus]|uniref:Cell division protein FtsX n=1 Tax=Brevibacillus laterosporus TaxID=1465 RepID=A0A502H632_BRELA|nr:permease-like cell division protein FtsX [Brevibacillus laterosporus]QDX91552.1 ABC transporter permease [Brevibacillus laterosporus]TPG69921.1 ABC transporter permease [Brevibacillus laterosporus]TPG85769.1 ABC transporter permease [Brevibacillus laterosporus]